MLQRLLGFCKMKTGRKIKAVTVYEFIELVGDHRALNVRIAVGLKPYNHEFYEAYVYAEASGKHQTVVYQTHAGYLQHNAMSPNDGRRAREERRWFKKVRDICLELEERYHGIDVRVSTLEGNLTLDRVQRHYLVAA